MKKEAVMTKKGNAIYTIFPYKKNGIWAFDDVERDVFAEPFVAGADTFLDVLANGKDRVGIIFSANEFPDSQISLAKVGGEISTGTDYFCERYQHELWLCPCLGVYFETSPERLFLKVVPFTP